MALVDQKAAERLFAMLPAEQRIGTLSPAYAVADARRSCDLEAVTFVYEDGSAFWMHSFHLSATPGVDAFDVQSPYGYGGPVSNSTDAAFHQAADDAYSAFCRERNVAAEFIRLHPLLAETQPYLGERYFDRQTVVIEIGENPPRMGYSTRARTAVRKAEKMQLVAAELPVGENIVAFANFYRAAMSEIGAAEFYLFEDAYFTELSRVPGMRLIAVLLDGNWVSAGLFLFEGETAEYHLSGTSLDGRNLGATNLLLDHAATLAGDAGMRRLYLGGGTNSSPENPLLFFKKSFSSILRPFCIGARIHRPDLYERLRDAHSQKYRSDRILFYRLAG